ncbi:uncharacterized protein C8Q71DRAFT_252395 [Rhodofomes roseus]|uniref:Uncharacterized protein n=1 Tax=Rhodofomes roseus TaxID=34475 RepID=A0ABQ8K742_9APHY|nr:uncharacterized protein C8Q71DRAFT_252395 [Rhodofomes roseus]KAH9833081.1 hypothetical protein C8Q71DRAFT_252395 [Rhodofomes roseus]
MYAAFRSLCVLELETKPNLAAANRAGHALALGPRGLTGRCRGCGVLDGDRHMSIGTCGSRMRGGGAWYPDAALRNRQPRLTEGPESVSYLRPTGRAIPGRWWCSCSAHCTRNASQARCSPVQPSSHQNSPERTGPSEAAGLWCLIAHLDHRHLDRVRVVARRKVAEGRDHQCARVLQRSFQSHVSALLRHTKLHRKIVAMLGNTRHPFASQFIMEKPQETSRHGGSTSGSSAHVGELTVPWPLWLEWRLARQWLPAQVCPAQAKPFSPWIHRTRQRGC